MKVESIAECSPWSIPQYFWPALSDDWSWEPFFRFFRVAVLHKFYCTKTLYPENNTKYEPVSKQKGTFHIDAKPSL